MRYHLTTPAEFATMIKIAILFVVVAIVLAVLSFGGLVVGFALGILKILFWIAAVIAIGLFILGYTVYREVT
jgi:uncharacterized membrane protein YtjA (UPF0391 family)